MIAYLSGPIENAHNDGSDWRNDITSWLNKELNHQVFNPVSETKNITKELNTEDFRLMKTTNPEQYKKIIRKIIQVDLDAVVNGSDYLIVNWDKSVFKGGGTHGEITMAYWFNKPIYMVNALPIEAVSSWIFSCTEYICSNFEDLKIKLKEIY